MARRSFTEVPYIYGDSKYGVAVGQTRNGVEELITLAGSMVWDSAALLWVPVSAAKPLPVGGSPDGSSAVAFKTTAAGEVIAQLSGSFATLRAMVGATKTATSVASEVFAGAQRLAGRRGLWIKNDHPAIRIRVDGAGITDRTGVAIEPFAAVLFFFDPAVDVPVYVISEAGNASYGVVEW